MGGGVERFSVCEQGCTSLLVLSPFTAFLLESIVLAVPNVL